VRVAPYRVGRTLALEIFEKPKSFGPQHILIVKTTETVGAKCSRLVEKRQRFCGALLLADIAGTIQTQALMSGRGGTGLPKRTVSTPRSNGDITLPLGNQWVRRCSLPDSMPSVIPPIGKPNAGHDHGGKQ
jgi:hypothetical protein